MPKRSKHLQEYYTSSETNKMPKLLHKANIFIGAHVSMSGGLHNAFLNANQIGAKAFALFLGNQRRWDFKNLSNDDINKFTEEAKRNNISLNHVVPHGSYLLNCGSPKEETLTKSRDLLIKEVQTCDKLGIKYFNFHPGSSCGLASTEETINRIATSINMALSQSQFVTVLIENMCGQGNTIGGKFQELQSIISLVKNKDRVGVCIDTCHAFAAGFPLHTKSGYNEMMKEFEIVIGMKYLKALHLNDSKALCGKHLDRHEDIGKGAIGLEFFKQLVNDPRMKGIPMILETPGVSSYKDQIQLLYSLIDETQCVEER